MESIFPSSRIHRWHKMDDWMSGLQGRYKKLDNYENLRPDTPLPEGGSAMTLKVKPLTFNRREKIVAGMRLRNRKVYPFDSDDDIVRVPEIVRYINTIELQCTFVIEDVRELEESTDVDGETGCNYTKSQDVKSSRISSSEKDLLDLAKSLAVARPEKHKHFHNEITDIANKDKCNRCSKPRLPLIVEEAWTSEKIPDDPNGFTPHRDVKNSLIGLFFLCSCTGYKFKHSKVGCFPDI